MRRLFETCVVGVLVLGCGDSERTSLTSPRPAMNGGGFLRGLRTRVTEMP